MRKVIAIVPKLVLTGGNLEVERLLSDLESLGSAVILLPIFTKKTSKILAVLGIPYFYLKVVIFVLWHRPDSLILTHYTTLPFAFIQFCYQLNIAVFVQDFEWFFLSKNLLIQSSMKSFHISIYRHVHYFVFANLYLKNNFPSKALRHLSSSKYPNGILYPVGSSSVNTSPLATRKCSFDLYDIGIILRNGWLKNEQLYYSALSCLFSLDGPASKRVCAINMLNSAASVAKYSALGVDLRPKMPHRDLCSWMSGLKIFLCLSIHEGFGLPPLEAMALGAIPLVLSNGGCTAYMSEIGRAHV